MRLLIVLCLGVTSLFGGEGDALLEAVRSKVMQTVTRLPRYMCTETIDRSTLAPVGKYAGVSCEDWAERRKRADWKLYTTGSDRLRLDVAVANHTEMYSWAGEDRFHDRSLSEMVKDGATSTGAFSSFISAVFATHAASFTYKGAVQAGGRALVEFSYRVPLEQSEYRIGTVFHNAVVPYEGTFLVDPDSVDLVSLTVHADHLPADLNACEDVTTLDYSSVKLNGSEFLLPKDVVLTVMKGNGGELENRTVFSGCHEFLGKSSVSFNVDARRLMVRREWRRHLRWKFPRDCPFGLALTHAIDTATAAAGDLVKAELRSPIKDSHRGVLAVKGAVVTGRITQLKRAYGAPFESLTVSLRLETVEVHGVAQPFYTRLESRIKRRVNPADAGMVRRDLARFDHGPDSEEPGVGMLAFEDVSRNYVIGRGVELEGVTAERPQGVTKP